MSLAEGGETSEASGPDASGVPSTVARGAWLLVHASALALVVATLLLAGQPLFANDSWIHLALGEHFLAEGPWLARDPHLFTAAVPPSPSSWLGSLAIFATWAIAGFDGLRIAHAGGVALILFLAFRLMRSAGATPMLASLGLVGFVLLATYRLVQLRPELFTIAAVLALYPLLFARATGPSNPAIATAAGLTAIWANVHAGFVLGPLLVLGGSAAIATSAIPVQDDATRRAELGRARRLALAGLALLLASLANPQGPMAHVAYLDAGRETMTLSNVVDEWNPTNFLAWPIPFLPPTPAAWLMAWLCVIAVAAAGLRCANERLVDRSRVASVDPALLALAVAGLAASVVASRFLWMGAFALALAVGLLSREQVARRTRLLVPLGSAAVALAAVLLHLRAGDWPLVSRALRAEGADFSAPYPAERFNTPALWFLADTAVEGRIYNDYPLGGFMSFWLAPRLQMSSSGTMNVEKSAMEANQAIAARQPLREDETYAELLDRQGIDLFLGLGFPVPARDGRPIPCTVRHLEREKDWISVFRNLRSAVYLRRNARNAANLDRIADYYARAGVPFDRERGFEPAAVLESAPEWALAQGLVPYDYPDLVDHVARNRAENRADLQTTRLSLLYAALGLYDRALDLDLFLRDHRRIDPDARWRIVWNLVQANRWKQAQQAARALLSSDAVDGGTSPWRVLAEQIRQLEASSSDGVAAHLPLMRPEQLDWIRNGVAIAPARSDRTP